MEDDLPPLLINILAINSDPGNNLRCSTSYDWLYELAFHFMCESFEL